jgi:phosphate transport system substrate-binding protein
MKKYSSTFSRGLLLLFACAALCFSQTSAAAETIRIFTGGPAAMKLINQHKAAFDNAGLIVEVRASDSREAAKFLVKGQIDGITSALPPEGTFKAGGLQADASGYKYFIILQTKINAALHPENKVSNLTHDQISGILTGKIKNWKELSGPDRAINILYLKTNFGLLNELRFKYLNGSELIIGDGLTDKDGLLRRLEKDPGAIGLVSGNDDLPTFKPKFIATDLSYPLYFITKKSPASAMDKVYEILQAK